MDLGERQRALFLYWKCIQNKGFVAASNNSRDKEIRPSKLQIVLENMFETLRIEDVCAGHFWKFVI